MVDRGSAPGPLANGVIGGDSGLFALDELDDADSDARLLEPGLMHDDDSLGGSGGGGSSGAGSRQGASSSLLPTDMTLAASELRQWSPVLRWVFVVPPHWEARLTWFDDPIIAFVQRYTQHPFFFYLALFITQCLAIEWLICVPVVLYFVGIDDLAVTYAFMAIFISSVSQIPKRFVWRNRPWMSHRAEYRRRDLTSSLPSRAVVCAVCYSALISWSYIEENGWTWLSSLWIVPLCIILPLLAALSRISLGVHYPSDCVLGFLEGWLVIGFTRAFISLISLGCHDCSDGHCYAVVRANALTWGHLGSSLNWLSAAVQLLLCFLFICIAILPPLRFWQKSDRVFGLLLPCLCFRFLFLCPDLNDDKALSRPQKHWFASILGLVLVGGSIAVTIVARKRLHSLLVAGIVFALVFVSLTVWRVTTQHVLSV